MVKTVGYTLVIKVLSALLSFFLIIGVSRWMGVADRGICSLYLVVVVVVTIVSDFAGGATAAYQLNHFSARQLFTFQRNWSFVPSITLPLLFWLAEYISLQDAFLLIVASWFYSNWNMLQHLWLGMQQFRIFNSLILGVPATSLLLFVVIWSLGLHNRSAYLLALLGSWAIGFLVSVTLFNKKQIKAEPEKSNGLFRKVVAAAATNQIGHLAGLLHSRLIFLLIPAASLGVYSNALTLAEACFMVPGSLGQVLYSIGASKQPDTAKSEILRLAWWANFTLLAIACVVFNWLPGNFYALIFGAGFQTMNQYMAWLTAGIMGNGTYLLLTYWQSAAGRFKLNLLSLLMGVVVNFTISLFMVIRQEYTLQIGILTMVAGWVIAAMGAIFMLHQKGGGLKQLLTLSSHKKK